MNQLATITSKKQLTLPAQLFKRAGLNIGQKVMVSEENGRLIITPPELLVEELAGSVPMPKKWRGLSVDEIINEAREAYFKERSKRYRVRK